MIIYGNKKFLNSTDKIVAFNKDEFFLGLEKIEKLRTKYYLAGYISYQAYKILTDINCGLKSDTPLLYFEVFEAFNEFNFEHEKQQKTYELFIKENITFEQYSKNIEKIKEYLKNGDSYEVNYTFSNDIYSSIDGYDLFLNLLNSQKTKYSAYIKNEFQEILSFSPELFFKVKDNQIFVKPMKGTLKRNGDDKKEISFLKNDKKNICENTMIVDLLRNDLASIQGSSNVKVEQLFEVETHKTLHQMTSTISAKLNEINFKNILSSIFPCGSITGAPKISTMEIIEKIENYSRDVYCGAIGMIYKNDFEFSVPIRILEKKTNDLKYLFCQGGAIIHDSNTEDEYNECITKRAFLGETLDFQLIETILIKNNQPQLYFEHLNRLKNSAKEFGFKFNKELLNFKFENNKIARIVLYKNGEFKVEYREFLPSKTNKIIINPIKVYSKNPFLFHKTNYYPYFLKSYQLIKEGKIYDSVFLNENNELTQGSRTNILLKINNELLTPRLEAGLLNGVLRKNLLEKGEIKESALFIDDLNRAENVYLINSVRGIKEVELETQFF